MAVLMELDVPGMTTEHYDASQQEAGVKVRSAQGFIAHAAGPTANGFQMIEIWASEDDWNRWLTGTIIPMAQQMGMPPLEPRVTPLHNVITP